METDHVVHHWRLHVGGDIEYAVFAQLFSGEGSVSAVFANKGLQEGRELPGDRLHCFLHSRVRLFVRHNVLCNANHQ